MTFRKHDREHGELEDALRQSRPTPPDELLDRLVARAESNPSTERPVETPRRAFRRPVLGIAFASVFLALFAGFGGLGYASSVVSNATHGASITANGSGGTNGSVGHGAPVGEANNTSGLNGIQVEHPGSAHHQYPHFKLVCLITPRKEIPVILLTKVADFLIARGVAHAPPCNVHVNPR